MKLSKLNEALESITTEKHSAETLNETKDNPELRKALNDVCSNLRAKNVFNIEAYVVAFQDAIEGIYPDVSWWDVTGCDIFGSLFNDRNPVKTIGCILSQLKPKYITEDIDDTVTTTEVKTFHNDNGKDYTVIERSKTGQNALLKDNNGNWVVAWHMPKGDKGSWGQGRYFMSDEAGARDTWKNKYLNETVTKAAIHKPLKESDGTNESYRKYIKKTNERKNESIRKPLKENRNSRIQNMMDYIDSVINNPKVYKIVDKYDTSNDSGPEGYFTNLTDFDITMMYHQVKDALAPDAQITDEDMIDLICDAIRGHEDIRYALPFDEDDMYPDKGFFVTTVNGQKFDFKLQGIK